MIIYKYLLILTNAIALKLLNPIHQRRNYFLYLSFRFIKSILFVCFLFNLNLHVIIKCLVVMAQAKNWALVQICGPILYKYQ